MKGWQCPNCGSCYSPSVSECLRCRDSYGPVKEKIKEEVKKSFTNNHTRSMGLGEDLPF